MFCPGSFAHEQKPLRFSPNFSMEGREGVGLFCEQLVYFKVSIENNLWSEYDKVLVCFSGIGNILLFLTKYFQVGQVSFLRILPSEAANSGGKDKVGSCPTFIIMTEVYYEDDFLDTLLEFVQRTRVGRNIGHLGIYLRNETKN